MKIKRIAENYSDNYERKIDRKKNIKRNWISKLIFLFDIIIFIFHSYKKYQAAYYFGHFIH